MAKIKQNAEGNNIVQAGRDIIYAPRPVITVDFIPCPQCQYQISPFAGTCLACHFPVAQYFEAIEVRRQNKRNAILSFCLGMVVIFFASIFFYVRLPDFLYRDFIPFASIAFTALLALVKYIMFRFTGR